jgi:hypothetical protein
VKERNGERKSDDDRQDTGVHVILDYTKHIFFAVNLTSHHLGSWYFFAHANIFYVQIKYSKIKINTSKV